MNKKDKYLIIVISALTSILVIVFSFYLIKYIRSYTDISNNILYKASISDDTDYSVNIITNPYIEEEVIYSDKAYITSLVDYVTINFKYNYILNENLNLNYKYQIMASITGSNNDTSTKPIWTKDYNLLEEESLYSTKEISINESINIDIDQYNNLVNTFINELNLNASINLEVKLLIKIDNKLHTVTANVPLNVKTFDITLNKNFAEEEIEYISPPIKKETFFVKVIIYISLIIVIVIIYITVLKYLINRNKSKYVLERDKILKDYDNRIIEVTNFIKYTKWDTVTVKNMNELVELSNEAFEPIFFFERKKNNQKEAWFCILRDSVLYKFILYSKYEIIED